MDTQEIMMLYRIWITGASSGIGARLACDLTEKGAQVIVSARRIEQLNDVSKRCSGKHIPYVLPLDVLDLESHETAFNKIIGVFGKVDSLVLNAGRSQRNPAIDTPFNVTTSIMELNFFSVVHLAKVVLPSMINRKSGQVFKYYLKSLYSK
jgi:dehydrogenase/reductase SDR family protein 7